MATKKKENAVPEIIDNVEALEAKMKAMREAQKKFATYTHISRSILSCSVCGYIFLPKQASTYILASPGSFFNENCTR